MKKRGFTVIELMIVVLIICLLAALLFPVFSKAKISAKNSVGRHQLKQIGTAFLLYSQANDDRTPYVASLATMKLYREGKLDRNLHSLYAGSITIKEALKPFGTIESNWRSPADHSGPLPAAYDSIGSSYEYYDDFCSGLLTALTSPSESGIFREARLYRGDREQWWNDPRTMILHADTSVKLITWDQTVPQIERSIVDFGCWPEGLSRN